MNAIRTALFLGALSALAGCEQNISSDIYVRDLNDIAKSGGTSELKADINVSVYATGIADQCDKPSGKAIVDAVALSFGEATLMGCKKLDGSMNDEMQIRVASRLYSIASGGNIDPKYVVEFVVAKDAVVADQLHFGVVFSRPKYDELGKRLSNINLMAKLDFTKASIVLNLNNDERQPVHVTVRGGSFANGVPIDQDFGKNVEPREEVAVRLGNVKMAALNRDSGVTVLTLSPEKKTQ